MAKKTQTKKPTLPKKTTTWSYTRENKKQEKHWKINTSETHVNLFMKGPKSQ